MTTVVAELCGVGTVSFHAYFTIETNNPLSLLVVLSAENPKNSSS